MTAGTIIGFYGIGNSLWSEGIKTLVDQMVALFGWRGRVFNHYEWRAAAKWVKENHKAGEPLVLIGHSMGVNAADKLADLIDFPVDAFFSVDSAWPEVLAPNVRKVWSIRAENFGRFNVKGGTVNKSLVIPDTSHTTVDDSQKLYQIVRDELHKLADPVSKDPAMPEAKGLTVRMLVEIASHEGVVLEAYRDSVGVLTWSIGITNASGHKVNRYIGKPASLEKCLDVYVWLIATKYLPDVVKAFEGRDLTENQLAAALSFHWNTGAIDRASWVQDFRNGNSDQARINFMKWRKPPEILARRSAEYDLFFDGVWSGDGLVPLYGGVDANMKPVNPRPLNIKPHLEAALARFEANAAAGEAEDANSGLPVPVDPSGTLPASPEGNERVLVITPEMIDQLTVEQTVEVLTKTRATQAMLVDGLVRKIRVAERAALPKAVDSANPERTNIMNIGYISKLIGGLVGFFGGTLISKGILPADSQPVLDQLATGIFTPELLLQALFLGLGIFFAPKNSNS